MFTRTRYIVLVAGCLLAATAGPLLAQRARDASSSDLEALADELVALRAKVQRLKDAIDSGQSAHSPDSSDPAQTPAPGAMGRMGKGRMGGMGGAASPPGSGMGMMDKMDKMMGMMEKMMGVMSGGAPMTAAPMAGGAMPMMDDDMMEMAPMDGGAPAAGAPMAGGGMGMMDDDMDMMGMMGMGKMQKMQMAAALPGFPGVSHIYHIGATNFFLDHADHIELTTEQKSNLNGTKEKALLEQATIDRKVDQAEQELWMLTASDQPDAAEIEAKVREIEKMRGDKRLAFIRSVGETANLLTEAQRLTLLGDAKSDAKPDAHKAYQPSTK